MFATIDQYLFPEDCVVLEIVPHNRYIYPIFKNGSSSVCTDDKFRQLTIEEIKNLEVIEVYVRDPHDRFLSGVQTFIKNLGPELDKKTILFFVERYLYLNRHYCPQVYWLLNLSRYTDAKFCLRPWTELGSITTAKKNVSIPDSSIKAYFENNTKVQFFNEMDEVLTVNLINQVVTIEDIIETLKVHYGDVYNKTFANANRIVDIISMSLYERNSKS